METGRATALIFPVKLDNLHLTIHLPSNTMELYGVLCPNN